MQVNRSDVPVLCRGEVRQQVVQKERGHPVLAVLPHHAEGEDVADLGSGPEGGRQDLRILLGQGEVVPDFRHHQPYDARVVDAGHGEELWVGGDVAVPGVRVVDGEPLLAEALHLGDVRGGEEAELEVGGVEQGHALVGGGMGVVMPRLHGRPGGVEGQGIAGGRRRHGGGLRVHGGGIGAEEEGHPGGGGLRAGVRGAALLPPGALGGGQPALARVSALTRVVAGGGGHGGRRGRRRGGPGRVHRTGRVGGPVVAGAPLAVVDREGDVHGRDAGGNLLLNMVTAGWVFLGVVRVRVRDSGSSPVSCSSLTSTLLDFVFLLYLLCSAALANYGEGGKRKGHQGRKGSRKAGERTGLRHGKIQGGQEEGIHSYIRGETTIHNAKLNEIVTIAI